MIVKLIIGVALGVLAVTLWGVVFLWRMVSEFAGRADTGRGAEEEWDLLDGECEVVD